ncbi:hypothetical protein SLNSH_07310 [Alsobacter soli]|uniref:TfoX N-terminal domain-containing protein n=2 Tax=Alsobacter soli TaxID=2109933 RepID=A0A2T1HVY9_9HYPH|nr:hypothetical protein SLNSH_07310 [Alsobacter soli]
MFGGHGVFDGGLMVALLLKGVIYLKCDPETAPLFEAEGLEPFRYEVKGRIQAIGYRQLPEAAHDDPEVLVQWYGLARSAALRAAARKAKTSRRVKA